MTNTERTEVDMGYVQGFVNLIAQALVAATELPKQIESMQADLTTLHSDLERTKARNIELDTLVGDIRRQRDEAEQKLSEVKARLDDSTRAWEGEIKLRQDASHEVERLNALLTQSNKDRDEYGLSAMAAEDRAKAAEAKLDKLREAMGSPKEVPQAAPPPPANEPVAETKPWPTEPPKPVEPRKVYEGEAGFNDLSGFTEQFDYETKRYYRTA